MATWILLGTPIAIYGPTKKSAMCNIFQILRGDAGHILLDSILTNGVYGRAFIIRLYCVRLFVADLGIFRVDNKGARTVPENHRAGIVLVSVYQAFCSLAICGFTILSLTAC